MKTSLIQRIAVAVLLLAPLGAAQPQARTATDGTSTSAPFPRAIESDGMLLRFLGWRGSTAGLDNNGDLSIRRTLDISFSIIDPTGRKPFRIVHPTRLTKLTDDSGKDFADCFRSSEPTDLSALSGPVISFVEDSRLPHEGPVTDRPAVFSLVRCEELPGTVAEMSGVVSVSVPVGRIEYATPLKQSEEWMDVGPNVSIRIDSVQQPREDTCLVSGTVKLRPLIENDPGGAEPALLAISVLETQEGPPQHKEWLSYNRFQIRPIATESGSLFTFSLSLGGRMSIAEMANQRSLVVIVSTSTKVITLPFTFKNLPISDAPRAPAAPESPPIKE